LGEVIREDLVATRITIETYGEIVGYLEPDDPTSRQMMERMLAMERGDAEEMTNPLPTVGEDRRLAGHRN
jgi:bacterioferritin